MSINSKLSALNLANIKALAGDEYHKGQWGSNWKKYTISCTVAQQNSNGTSWHWDASVGAYVYGMPVGATAGGSSSNSSNVSYAPTTFKKDVCGAGDGSCWESAPSNHPCA